jgi:hypothetical protein
MNPDPGRQRFRVGSPAAMIAVIPHAFGFTPESSLVVIGADPATGRMRPVMRYDLPDPPDREAAAAISKHAVAVLTGQRVPVTVVIGYGPGRLVTPLADLIAADFPAAGIRVHDLLRVEEGRYWSYLCQNPACCPPEGVPLATVAATSPALAAWLGTLPRPAASRAARAASLAPVTGPDAETARVATRDAERDARAPSQTHGVKAVINAIGMYRRGGSLGAGQLARLAVALASLRVRDDAWARMDPAHREAHRRLWTDVVRHAQPGYVAAPACLLAVAAWQSGDGTLANLALDRATADDPGSSMARLLRDAIVAGLPPSAATPPVTPEQVAASYAARDCGRAPAASSPRPPASPQPEPGSEQRAGPEAGAGL